MPAGDKKIKVVELFAGVGGFQLALKQASENFDVIFSNQWEPGKKSQYAFEALKKNFLNPNDPEDHKRFSNVDIAQAKYEIPKDIDLLVGGFPCQDYSVAATKAQGIEGKKGVLWWEISWILRNRKPKMVLLENVDRLLKSPSNMRGRDFAIILKNLDRLGYNVEWRVINAADYGFAQRRRRIFVFATYRGEKTSQYLPVMRERDEDWDINKEIERYISASLFSKRFGLIPKTRIVRKINLRNYKDEFEITNNYNEGKFLNAGYIRDGKGICFDYESKSEKSPVPLKEILERNVPDSYYIKEKEKIEKIKYLKGAKKILRTRKDGTTYNYSEGSMHPYEKLEAPARTILTSEGTISRSSHFIRNNNGVRRLTPVELERLNGFQDGWTNEVMPERMRYFCMGNALVVPLVKEIALCILFLNLRS